MFVLSVQFFGDVEEYKYETLNQAIVNLGKILASCPNTAASISAKIYNPAGEQVRAFLS